MNNKLDIVPIKYDNGKLFLLDQTKLPVEEVFEEVTCKEDMWDAIYKLKVRGAPAIGVAAAYGLYIEARNFQGDSVEDFIASVLNSAKYLESARPTAVNLAWALKRMTDKLLTKNIGTVEDGIECLFEEAVAIRLEDVEACKRMGEYGLSLLKPNMGILTHCNAGTIATAKYGTCLAPIHLGQEQGYNFKVFADETRPLLQGARLTAWELQKNNVDVTLICDNMAATVMKNGWIDAVVVGCDRMAANGDGANKIGTLGVAILAKEYGIPFYMFVPTSTIDLDTPTGDDINIELRDGEEIYKMWYEKPMAPEGIKTFNPAFDVTNHQYITAVITEKGIVRPPYHENLRALMQGE
jgi:methylthioribose-1-phosphate isomerase